MTQNQERAIERIRTAAENEFDYKEVKGFTVTDHEYFISVAVSIGMKEEALSDRFFCRDHANFFVGKRGGVTYPMYHDKDNQYCKRWNGSFLSAVVDQRENIKKVWG